MNILFSRKITFLLLLTAVTLIFAGLNAPEYSGRQGSRIDSLFSAPIATGKVENPAIDEASGLAASQRNPSMLWTHNDSGDDARIFLMTDSGKHAGIFYLKGVEALDLEDIAVGPGPEEGVSYIYLADIGDNWASREEYQIYRFPEPLVTKGSKPVVDTIRQIDVIRFTYPDAKRDAETLMIDPATKDLYIVSKREANVILYRLPFPQTTTGATIPEKLGYLPLTIIVGGDISPDGQEVLLKSYNEIYYWEKGQSDPLYDVLSGKPKLLPYAIEPQGEAVAWAADGSGYYTVSEEILILQASLFFYKRR